MISSCDVLFQLSRLVPTEIIASPYTSDQFHQLSSSKDEAYIGETSSVTQNLRKKRLFFLDKNQFVVSTTITSFSFANSTLTVTRSLLAAAGQCLEVAAAGAVPQCVACLPSGYVVCAAAG